MTKNTFSTNRATSRRKVLTGIVSGLLATTTAGTVTATNSSERTTTAGGTEVNKNEILFARRNLPHYLDETILNGDTRVTVTQSGERPPEMNPQDYDVMLSSREHRQILDSAIDKYLDKFGVNPSAPEIQMIDGEPYTNEETQKLLGRETIKRGKIKTEQSASDNSPNPVDGTVRVHMLEAADEQHQPQEAWYDDSIEAWDRFDTFGPTTRVTVHYGHWEPNGEGKKADDLLGHLEETQSDKRENNSELVAGWVDHASNNGIARITGFYSVSAASVDLVDWPHDSIFQHELSHNFGARHENDRVGCFNPLCIMNYGAAKFNETGWCDGCHDDITDNIS